MASSDCQTISESFMQSAAHSLLALILFAQFFGSNAFSVYKPQQTAAAYDCENTSQYYKGVDGLKGEQLKKKLYRIIRNHDVVPYVQVWEALKVLDAADSENSEESSDIIEIYTQRAVSKTLAAKSEGWNREHLWPHSYGLRQGQPEFTDLHNLRPADMNVNSARGNKYYGDCTQTKTVTCLVPANTEAALDTATDKESWTPPSQVRGDVARALLYMAVRYGIDEFVGKPLLSLSDTPNAGDAQMGLLSVLLHWNVIDPPSREEKMRNSKVCTEYQHNRNPFVDHPDYAALIWKRPLLSGSEGTLQSVPKVEAGRNAWINELHYENKGADQNEFIEVLVGSSVDPRTLAVILYNGKDGKAYRWLSLDDSTVFSSVRGVARKYFIYTAVLPPGSIQNGPADGMALVEEGESIGSIHVLQFLSYEGTFKASNGPAKDLESMDIAVRESSNSSISSSLGLSGTGASFRDFVWSAFPTDASPGALNSGQRLISTSS